MASFPKADMAKANVYLKTFNSARSQICLGPPSTSEVTIVASGLFQNQCGQDLIQGANYWGPAVNLVDGLLPHGKALAKNRGNAIGDGVPIVEPSSFHPSIAVTEEPPGDLTVHLGLSEGPQIQLAMLHLVCLPQK